MTRLRFEKDHGRLTVETRDGVVYVYPALNIVDSHSEPWPAGTFPFAYWKAHPEDDDDGPYGPDGIAIFDVPGRVGLGIHAGRKNDPDRLGRQGREHATNGCIRVDGSAMHAIAALHAKDPLTLITVD